MKIENRISDSALLESFFEYSSDTIITVNRLGEVLFANRSTYAHHHNIEVGANLFEQENDHNAKKLLSVVQQVFESQKAENFFFTSSEDDVDTMIYSGAINPIIVENKVVAATIVARDMTATIQTKRDLESFEKRLKSALKSSKIIVWEWSVNSKKLIVEGEYESIYQQERDSHKSLSDLFKNVHPEDIDTLKYFLRKALEDGEAFEMDYKIQVSEDHYKFLHLDVEAFTNKVGKVSRLIGTISDLSTQKESEHDVLHAIVTTQEEERNRLGKELHDNIGQMLTATKLQLNAGLVKLKNGDDTAPKKLELALKILSEVLDETRSFSHQLSPGYLSKGLSFALEELTKNLSGDEYDTIIDIEQYSPDDLPDLVALNIFRIAQELLNNAIKHAKASKIRVKLSENDGILELEIKDNGKGFDTQESYSGIGLQNIENRVALIEGDFNIESSSKGTIATVSCTPNLFAQL